MGGSSGSAVLTCGGGALEARGWWQRLSMGSGLLPRKMAVASSTSPLMAGSRRPTGAFDAGVQGAGGAGPTNAAALLTSCKASLRTSSHCSITSSARRRRVAAEEEAMAARLADEEAQAAMVAATQ